MSKYDLTEWGPEFDTCPTLTYYSARAEVCTADDRWDLTSVIQKGGLHWNSLPETKSWHLKKKCFSKIESRKPKQTPFFTEVSSFKLLVLGEGIIMPSTLKTFFCNCQDWSSPFGSSGSWLVQPLSSPYGWRQDGLRSGYGYPPPKK